MGIRYDWVCTECKCEYKAFYGGGSAIMSGPTYPYVCNYYNHVEDYLYEFVFRDNVKLFEKFIFSPSDSGSPTVCNSCDK